MQKINEYLKEILNESLFIQGEKNEYFYEGTYKYVKAVLEKILRGEPIRIGEHGEKGTLPIELDDEGLKEIENFLNQIDGTTFEEFNNLLKKYLPENWQKKNVWRTLFKGDFSGYVDGLDSKNKGNAFETYFYNNYNEIFMKQLENLGYISKELITQAKPVGGDNNKRGIKFEKNGVTNIANSLDIGKVVSDIDIIDSMNPDDTLLHLSLKYGSKVTFINMGIQTIFNEKTINGIKKMPPEGQTIMEMFGLELEQIKDVFENYDTKNYVFSSKEKEVDVTNLLKRNKLFKSFMQNVIGYGYILVHAENDKFDKVGYLDLREPKTMKDLINNLKSATIYYGGKGHTGKRVDINIEFGKMSVLINLRSKKENKIYPTHIMCDYTIYKYDKVLTDKDI